MTPIKKVSIYRPTLTKSKRHHNKKVSIFQPTLKKSKWQNPNDSQRECENLPTNSDKKQQIGVMDLVGAACVLL
jgi:hypothetical protein